MVAKGYALSWVLSGLALVGASPHPLVEATTNRLFKRAVVPSPDNTCGSAFGGAGKNYTCTTSNLGTCCSQYGYCGSSTDYCGTGCQPDFGSGCMGGDPDPPPGEEDDFTCGPTNGNKRCSGTLCCSINGWCGNTTDYCGTGCQPNFGSCDTTLPPPGTRCGKNNGGAKCSNSQCCSAAGYCGTGTDYCSAPDCQTGYGTCDADKTPSGSSTANIPRPKLGDVPYGEDIYDCNKPGYVALTYDDGPSEFTSELLDRLKSYNFKATFFITGVNNGKGSIDDTSKPWPSVIKRMIAEGHQVASHTWSHADMSSLTTAGIETEMVKNEMALRNILGKFPTYMRPPYSNCNSQCVATMNKLGYHITYFDLDTTDYLHTTPDTVQQAKDETHKLLAALSPASNDYLSIAHDIHRTTVQNFTKYMFDDMVKLGWKGTSVGDCLNDPESNWYRSDGGTTTTSTRTTTTRTSTTSTSSTRTSTTTTRTSTSTTSTRSTTSTTRPPTTTTRTTTTTRPPTTTTTPAAPFPTSRNCKTYFIPPDFCAQPIGDTNDPVKCFLAKNLCDADVTVCKFTVDNPSACDKFEKDYCGSIKCDPL